MVVDLESPIPPLVLDGKYLSAMVVGRRNGIPFGSVEVDLTANSFDDQLAPLFEPREQRLPVDSPVTQHRLPSISVVVPTIVARVEDLNLLLDGFAEVEYPQVEFILVDNRRVIPTADPLPQLISGRPRVRALREGRPGISAARNAGLEAAKGEIVVFTDDDVRVDPRWLLAIGSRFVAEPHLDAVTGLILPAELETPAQIWFERYYGGFSGQRTFAPLTLKADQTGPRLLRGARVLVEDARGHQIRRFAIYGVGGYGAGANMAFRRSTLNRIGGFDLALGTGTPARGGEDLAAMIAVLWNGGKLGYEPAAVVHHRHRREFEELLHQLRGNGLGFTAMLTSLVSHDQRHLLGILSQLPVAARRVVEQTVARIQGKRAGGDVEGVHQGSMYPRELVMTELSGFPKGPLAYVRSRRASRKLS